jgi:hypothetical protein
LQSLRPAWFMDQVPRGGFNGRNKAEHSDEPQAASVATHPEKYRHDLNPNAMEGQNIGQTGPHPEKNARTAHDIKELHRRFSDWSDDDLKQIPVLPAGSRLEQNATYVDLAAGHIREFTATANMEAGRNHQYVPKSEVHHELWNRLLGVKNVARTGIATGSKPPSD